jgi:hypothetical protein
LGFFQSHENRGQLHRTDKGLSPRHPSLRPGLHHLQKTRAFQREDTTSHGMTQSILLFPEGEKKNRQARKQPAGFADLIWFKGRPKTNPGTDSGCHTWCSPSQAPSEIH